MFNGTRPGGRDQANGLLALLPAAVVVPLELLPLLELLLDGFGRIFFCFGVSTGTFNVKATVWFCPAVVTLPTAVDVSTLAC